MKESYLDYINELASGIPKSIVDLSQPRRRSKPPSQAFSQFAIHREQGDWAEMLVTQALSSILTDFDVIKYGKTDTVMAGEAGFKEFYNRYQDELDSIGKRPDILIFRKGVIPKLSDDISDVDFKQLGEIVPLALAGFEIRSSSFLSKKYKTAQQKSTTQKRTFLSFTPKVEDLMVVLKWITIYRVPLYYVQVFFDAAYIIPFHKILKIISNPANKNRLFTIETSEKNQQKRTIHLDIGQGLHLGDISLPPEHYSAVKALDRGRLLYYVKFKGAKLELNHETLDWVLDNARRLAQGNFSDTL